MAQTRWFKRLQRECRKISPHLKFKRAKYGFWRIYWLGGGDRAYIHEIYEELPEVGYDIEEKDIRLTSQKYYEEYEDSLEITRKIKNYVEGYWDSLRTIQKRAYLMKNSKEHYYTSVNAYKQIVVR